MPVTWILEPKVNRKGSKVPDASHVMSDVVIYKI